LLAAPFGASGTSFPITAYSEFLPPPWVGVKPSGALDACIRSPGDNWGWNVSEYEQAGELGPGLAFLARHLVAEVVALGSGRPIQISHRKLRDNPYWPPELAAHAGRLTHERYVVLAPVALARTQDDKGRVLWTLFGSSEQGPARPFWRGFYTAPGQERPAAEGRSFLTGLLTDVYGIPRKKAGDPAAAGLRVLPAGDDPQFPGWGEESLPSWCDELRWDESQGLKGVHFLLTFRPFARLPEDVRRAYLAGELHLLPFPGSLVFWGTRDYRTLQRELPLAMQVPLLQLYPRCHGPHGIRIPQSGWLGEHAGLAPEEAHTPYRSHYQRTHRWQRVHRHQDETALFSGADRVTHVLFSTNPDDLGLYGKPMARNAQLWTHDYRLLLDGPCHGRAEIARAESALAAGGQFGYRFLFPAMRVGPWEVYWHRPLAAFPDPRTGAARLLESAPTGYLTAYPAGAPDLEHPVELWPRLLDRPLPRAAVELFADLPAPRRAPAIASVRSFLSYHEMLGPLAPALARSLLAVRRRGTLRDGLNSLVERANNSTRARRLVAGLEKLLDHDDGIDPNEALTLNATARREFEVAYWQTIAFLAHSRFRNKDNADCVRDAPTRAARPHGRRDLEPLGDHLQQHYVGVIRRAGLEGQAWVGEHVFRWTTDFRFPWSGGWAKNQTGKGHERNLVVRIPGRDPSQAVVMADHYDTAYMHDVYEGSQSGTGARLAAALMLAAPLFLELSKAGRLACDIWLIHLTGEEFPSDCLGARHLTQALVEGRLSVREPSGIRHELTGVRPRGIYVSDMIAHNNDRGRDIFQIAPGEGPASAWLALQAHHANRLWNERARQRNRTERRGRGRSQRSDDPAQVPAPARCPSLRGEVRPPWDPRSTLYNTDGQIFADAGFPVVLFMENYDINRSGYHDTRDTMGNIDLDYGSALAAIVIETVARTAAAAVVPGAAPP
jgi:hypothetical protein